MKKTLFTAVVFIAIDLAACTENKISAEKVENNKEKIESTLNNLVSIVEIPTSDLSRAVNFYEAILGLQIEEMEMDGNQMGILPNQAGTVNVVLIKGKDYTPTSDGAVLYLNAGNDLQVMLNKIEPNGGQVILPKTMISPEMGYFALFIDTEGNRVGLHSKN